MVGRRLERRLHPAVRTNVRFENLQEWDLGPLGTTCGRERRFEFVKPGPKLSTGMEVP